MVVSSIKSFYSHAIIAMRQNSPIQRLTQQINENLAGNAQIEQQQQQNRYDQLYLSQFNAKNKSSVNSERAGSKNPINTMAGKTKAVTVKELSSSEQELLDSISGAQYPIVSNFDTRSTHEIAYDKVMSLYRCLEFRASAVNVVDKYERMAADEALSDDKRAFCSEAASTIKKNLASVIEQDLPQYQASGEESINRYQHALEELLGKKALGLESLETMDTTQMREALNGALSRVQQTADKLYGNSSVDFDTTPRRLDFSERFCELLENGTVTKLDGWEKYGVLNFDVSSFEDMKVIATLSFSSIGTAEFAQQARSAVSAYQAGSIT